MDITVKLKQLIAKFRVPCYALGIEFMDSSFKINPRTLTITGFIAVYLSCSAYTIFTASPQMALECLVFLGTGAQGCVKFPIPLQYCVEGRAILKKIENLYYDIQRKGQSSLEYKLLSKCVYVCDKVFSLYILIFALGFLIASSYPVIMYFVFDEKVLLITMIIPGVDPMGKYGFFIHGTCHITMAMIVCVGSPAGDFFFMFCIAHIYMFVDFLHLRIERFNRWLLETVDEVHDREWRELVASKMDEILAEHQELLQFMEQLDDMYFAAIAVHIGTASVSLGIGLFMTVTTDWYVAYMLVLIALFQLFVYSTLGTIVELKNDHLTQYAYEILWYLLPVVDQKKMVMLLKRCQRPKRYTIARMAPLNLDTFVKILKTIYSFFMMLVNSL